MEAEVCVHGGCSVEPCSERCFFFIGPDFWRIWGPLRCLLQADLSWKRRGAAAEILPHWNHAARPKNQDFLRTEPLKACVAHQTWHLHVPIMLVCFLAVVGSCPVQWKMPVLVGFCLDLISRWPCYPSFWRCILTFQVCVCLPLILYTNARTHTRTLTRLNMAIVDTLQTIISREGSIQDTYYWIHMDS